MQIAIARDALNPALVRAATVVPSSSPIPVVNCVMFVVGPDGCIVTATDLSAMFSETVDDVAREHWSECIDSAQSLGFTKSISPGSTLDLTADARALTIAGDGATAKLLTISAAEFPSFGMRTDPAPVAFDIEAAALATALKFTEPTASEDHILRPNLWGAFLDPDGLVVTTDMHRMATYRLTTSPPDFEGVILPLPIVRTLPGLLKGFVDTVTISVSSRLITFAAGKWRLT